MSYQALYRAYRPIDLNEIEGQDHITKTLMNALLQDKFSHAYLFTGPRGSGKTSSAKAFGKAINCENRVDGKACGTCKVCQLGDNNPDVIETDAASNNGVEEIREIRDKVRLSPMNSKYKVYIIDEVHMLTDAAQNAFLKTLEEPPPHAIFILATTEPHKILPTIISRCQRYDFKRINQTSLVKRLTYIVEQEGMKAEEKAIEMIARIAQGGMRDAISLLDQAISYTNGEVTTQDVEDVTGTISLSVLNDIADAIQNKDLSTVIETVNSLVEGGKDPQLFVDDLTLFYRDILLYQTIGEGVELSKALLDDEFKELTQKIDPSSIDLIIDELTKCKNVMRTSSHAKAALEISLVSICHQQNQIMTTIKSMEKELEALRIKVTSLEDGGMPTNVPMNDFPPVEHYSPLSDRDDQDNQELVNELPSDPLEETEEAAVTEGAIDEFSDSADFITQLEKDLASNNPPSYLEIAGTTETTEDVTEPETKETKKVESKKEERSPLSKRELKIKKVLNSAKKPLKNEFEAKRAEIEEFIKKDKISVSTLFSESDVAIVSENEVVITYPKQSKVKEVERVANRSIIQSAIEDVIGRPLTLISASEEEWTRVRDEFIQSRKKTN